MLPRARKKASRSRISTCGGDSCYSAVREAANFSGRENLPEQVSYDDGSQYSLTPGILPSLGGNTNRRSKRLPRYIVSPFDCRLKTWQIYLVLLVFYTAWVSPFELGFLDKPTRPLAITDNVVNGFFAIDIVLTFFVAYLDKDTFLLIDNHKQIAWRYARTWLIFDIISTVPFEIVHSILPSPLQQYGVFNILRLWRLRRVGAMFASLEKDKNFNYFWLRCLKLVMVTLFSVHMAGCFFYLLADHYLNPESTWIGLCLGADFHERTLWQRYVASIYWSITTLSTTGYGDIHPVNSREMLFDIIYMLFNLALTSYIIGNMSSLVVHGTNRTRSFRDTIQAARHFAHRNRLPNWLQDQMLAHLILKYRTDSEGLQQQETIDSLPKAIRSNISRYLFYSLVDRVYLFRGVSNDLLFQLVSEMKAEYFPPKEDVILQNEAPTDLYLLVTGAMELIVKRNGVEEVVGEARKGDVCGEVGVLCYRPQIFTVRTKRLSQLLRLNRTSFLNIVQSNVGDGTIIMNNLLQHLKEKKDPIMQEIYHETEQMLARGRMELPLSLCFAAIRGDDLLLHQLLRRGSDPNEGDENGRRPLHIAAAIGSEHCVTVLLEFGADPNVKDSEGNIPLWDAIMGEHKPVIKLLVDNGAMISAGDVGSYACTAIEQNKLGVLMEIVNCGGDVTLSTNSGTTPLHVAVSEGSAEIVRFLLDQGANIDRPDIHGWTPRNLADHQGHEDIMELFQNIKQPSKPPTAITSSPTNQGFRQNSGSWNPPKTPGAMPRLGKYSSEPTMHLPLTKYSSDPSVPLSVYETLPPLPEGTLSESQRRRKANNFQNSLFGIMQTAAGTGGRSSISRSNFAPPNMNTYRARVTISCPDKGETASKLVLLPQSLQDLLQVGSSKFGCKFAKITTLEGAEVDDIDLIRDGDHLLLIANDPTNTEEQ
ncbi:hypothetical protein SAY86_023676 [Trapa natans]|uniref:Potassium channel n=1 Tax=Trapa natans TaxID=22666 RepID=A0AAN7LUW7_TRANT|nr:hypothetical protein SAY86_023676 [Trapa natans]